MRALLGASGVVVAGAALIGVGIAARDSDLSACGRIGDREHVATRDGARLAFVRCTAAGSAWLYVAERGRERRLVPGSYGCCYRPSDSVVFGDPAWSPDGRRVAVVIADVGGTDVWVLDVASAAARRLTSGPAREADPWWSANGRRITFRTETGRAASVVAAPASPRG